MSKPESDIHGFEWKADQTAYKWSPNLHVPKLTMVLVTLLCNNLITCIHVEHVGIPSAHREQ